MPLLEQRFGSWAAPAVPKGLKTFTAPAGAPDQAAGSSLIDRPGSPQSVILGGQLTPIDPFGDIVPVQRRQRGLRRQLPVADQHGPARDQGLVLWRALVDRRSTSTPCLISINAPVQSDKTGEFDPRRERQLGLMLGKKGVTAEELTRLVSNNVDALPGRFETVGSGARRDDDQRPLSAGRTIITSCWPTSTGR